MRRFLPAVHPAARARSAAHFTPESPRLQQVAAACGYKSLTWVESADTGTLRRAGRTLRKGAAPTTTKLLRAQRFYNVDQLATTVPPFPVATPHDLATQKPIGGLVGRCLFNAAEERGYDHHWWATTGMFGSELVSRNERATTVITDGAVQLYNLDQFEEPKKVRECHFISPSRTVVVPRNEAGEAILHAIRESNWKTGLCVPGLTLAINNVEPLPGAVPIALPPTEAQMDSLLLYNIDELEDGEEFARAHQAAANDGKHMLLPNNTPLFYAEALGDDAFKFTSRLWVFKRHLQTSMYPQGARPRPGTGRVFLPPSWALKYGLHLFNADDVTDPTQLLVTVGFTARDAYWATKSGGPPAHTQAYFEALKNRQDDPGFVQLVPDGDTQQVGVSA